MTRPIKFRAWNPFDKEMYYLSFSGWKWNWKSSEPVISFGKNNHKDVSNEVFDAHDFVLMQFTGLLDVEGKEIYEGDVVKTPKYIIGSEPAYYENHEVVFDRGIFGLKPTHHITPLAETESGVEESKDYISNYGEIYRRYRPEVEVIGNIYENPELIK